MVAGLVVATFCYAQFFPPPYTDEGKISIAFISLTRLLVRFMFSRLLDKMFHKKTSSIFHLNILSLAQYILSHC
jgi:hypothetical protein